jgi:hypothetical protein
MTGYVKYVRNKHIVPRETVSLLSYISYHTYRIVRYDSTYLRSPQMHANSKLAPARIGGLVQRHGMGNAPSVAELPPEWEEILPNVNREDILRSSRKNCRVEENKSVYLDDDLFDLDEHVPTALAILRAAPLIKDIRFKMVPGILTEEMFWAALFGVLQYGGIDIDHVAGKIDDDYETGDEGDRFGTAQSPPEDYLGKC